MLRSMEYAFQEDHIHLVMIIPPKYSVSEIVGKIKANTSREIRKRFPWVKELYTKNEFWSPWIFFLHRWDRRKSH